MFTANAAAIEIVNRAPPPAALHGKEGRACTWDGWEPGWTGPNMGWDGMGCGASSHHTHGVCKVDPETISTIVMARRQGCLSVSLLQWGRDWACSRKSARGARQRAPSLCCCLYCHQPGRHKSGRRWAHLAMGEPASQRAVRAGGSPQQQGGGACAFSLSGIFLLCAAAIPISRGRAVWGRRGGECVCGERFGSQG